MNHQQQNEQVLQLRKEVQQLKKQLEANKQEFEREIDMLRKVSDYKEAFRNSDGKQPIEFPVMQKINKLTDQLEKAFLVQRTPVAIQEAPSAEVSLTTAPQDIPKPVSEGQIYVQNDTNSGPQTSSNIALNTEPLNSTLEKVLPVVLSVKEVDKVPVVANVAHTQLRAEESILYRQQAEPKDWQDLYLILDKW